MADPSVVKAVIAFDGDAPAARSGALFHPRDGAERRRPGLSPHRHLRLSPADPGALRRAAAQPAGAARAARAAARARGRHDGSAWRSLTRFRSASILPPIWSARELCSARPERRHPANNRASRSWIRRPTLTGLRRASAVEPARRIVFQGQPGAYSHLACRQVCPRYEAVPAESFEDGVRRRARGARRAGDDPDRQFGRRPGRRHPSPDAALRPAHRRRAFPAREPSPAGGARARGSRTSRRCTRTSMP